VTRAPTAHPDVLVTVLGRYEDGSSGSDGTNGTPRSSASRSSARHASLLGRTWPFSHRLTVENVTVTADDGVKLAGWLIPRAGAPAIVLLHGYPAEKADLLPIAAALAPRPVRLVDERFTTVLAHDARRLRFTRSGAEFLLGSRYALLDPVFSEMAERPVAARVERILVSLGGGLWVGEVAAAPRMTWLPIELNVRMVEAAAAAFGEARGLEILAGCVFAQFETALWKGFIGGAVRLLGTQPGSLGRWIPQAMGLVFRDCGSWSAAQSGEAELSVEVRDLPAALAPHRLWLRSLAIGMTPLFTLCGAEGSSELAELDPHARRARYRLHWKPRG